jgi:hypothetical protein
MLKNTIGKLQKFPYRLDKVLSKRFNKKNILYLIYVK